jgi:hypothetical protein
MSYALLARAPAPGAIAMEDRFCVVLQRELVCFAGVVTCKNLQKPAKTRKNLQKD